MPVFFSKVYNVCVRSALDQLTFRICWTRFESKVRSCLTFRLIEEWLLAELEGATPESKLADLSLSSVSLAQLHARRQKLSNTLRTVVSVCAFVFLFYVVLNQHVYDTYDTYASLLRCSGDLRGGFAGARDAATSSSHPVKNVHIIRRSKQLHVRIQ